MNFIDALATPSTLGQTILGVLTILLVVALVFVVAQAWVCKR